MTRSSRIVGILVLSALLSTAGCTTMVMDRYRGATMTPSLYFRLDDIETPEVHVTWVHHLGGEKREAQEEQEGQPPSVTPLFGDRPNLLTIRPDLEGCPFVAVSLNGESLYAVGEWIPVSAIRDGEVMIPDQDDPDCSLMLTFRTLGSPPTFSIVAATRNGVVEEFPDGKRKGAWLLLIPPTVLWDTVWATAVLAVYLVSLDPAGFARL